MCEGVITYRSGRVGLRDDQVITGNFGSRGGGWGGTQGVLVVGWDVVNLLL